MTLPAHKEMDGYPKQKATRTGLSATRKIECAWADRFTLCSYFLGWPPPIYEYDAYWKARVTSVEVEGFGCMTGSVVGDDSRAVYDKAILTVEYNTPGESGSSNAQPHPDPAKADDPEAAISESLEPFLEALKLNPADFMWSSDHRGLSPEEAPLRYLHRCRYTLVRYNLTSVPNAMIDNIGRVNNAVHNCILIPNLYFPLRTLLYESPRLSSGVSPDGTPVIEAAMAFSYKEETWWKYWRANKTGGAGNDMLAYRYQPGDYEFPEEFDMSTLLP